MWAPRPFAAAPYAPQPGLMSLQPDTQYDMPVFFGGRTPEPKPTLDYPSVSSIVFSYETDTQMLLPIIPSVLQLREPVVTVAFGSNANLEWLAGRGCESVAVTVPVRYTAPDGTTTDGEFNLVEFDNLAEPMLLARDLVGAPKVFANISHSDETVRVWYNQGPNGLTEFLTLDVSSTAAAAAPAASTTNSLNWRYYPSALGGSNNASVSQLTLVPVDTTPVAGSAAAAQCTLKWTAAQPSPEHDPPGHPGWWRMPTMWRFPAAFAPMPIRNGRCSAYKGARSLRLDRARVLYDDVRPGGRPAPHAQGLPHGTFDNVRGINTSFRMPITFGGNITSGDAGVAYYPSNANLYLVYETDAEALRAFIPSGLTLLNGQLAVSFSWRCDAMPCDAMRCDALRCAALRCGAMRCDAMRCDAMRCDAMRCDAMRCEVSFSNAERVDWLAGRGYRMVTVSASVGFTRANGSTFESSLTLAVWEDWSDCLITGREMSGVPKIWADIDVRSDASGAQHAVASWGGLRFMDLSVALGPDVPQNATQKQQSHGLQWKFFPQPGRPTHGQLSELTDYPADSRLKTLADGTACALTWLPGRPASSPVTAAEAPAQYRVLNALAGLPVRNAWCGRSTAEVWLRNDLSVVLAESFMQL